MMVNPSAEAHASPHLQEAHVPTAGAAETVRELHEGTTATAPARGSGTASNDTGAVRRMTIDEARTAARAGGIARRATTKTENASDAGLLEATPPLVTGTAPAPVERTETAATEGRETETAEVTDMARMTAGAATMTAEALTGEETTETAPETPHDGTYAAARQSAE